MAYRHTDRVERRLAGRRAAILRATRALVAEAGFRDLQMQAIAAAAGLATGTLYRYFPSKSALSAELVALVSEREVGIVRAIAAGDGDLAGRLQHAIRTFARRALRGRTLAYAMIAEPVEAEVDRVRLAYRAELAEVFRALIAEGVAAGRLPPQQPAASAAGIVGAFMEGLVGPLAPDSLAPNDGGRGLVEEVAAFCLRAVGDDAADTARRGGANGRATA